eukprot:8625298-Pyramimonas_sp.AAC.1
MTVKSSRSCRCLTLRRSRSLWTGGRCRTISRAGTGGARANSKAWRAFSHARQELPRAMRH